MCNELYLVCMCSSVYAVYVCVCVCVCVCMCVCVCVAPNVQSPVDRLRVLGVLIVTVRIYISLDTSPTPAPKLIANWTTCVTTS